MLAGSSFFRDLVQSGRFHDNSALSLLVDPVFGVSDGSRGNLACLTTAVAATICFVTLLGGIFPWLVRWYQSYRASELLHRIEVAESQALSSPMQQLACLGIPAMESLILASASPRSEVALIARRIVEEKSTSWIVKSNADSQFDYATPAIKLARTLAEHVVKFDPAGKQWCENLVLRFIKRSDQLSADKATELLEHCNRVLVAVPPRSPRLRTLVPIVPEKSFPSLQPLETPPIDLGTISVPGESTLIVKSSSSSNDTGATTNKATVDPQQRIAEELSAQPLSRPPASSWSPQWTRTPESSAESTTSPGDRDDVRGDLGGTGVVEIPTLSQMHRRARQLREKSTAQLTRMVPNAKFYEARI